MSLQRKLFTAFVCLIIVPLLVLGTIAYQIIANMTENRYSDQTELTLRALLRNVEQVFNEMNKVTDSTIASDAIQEALLNWQNAEIGEINYLELNEVQKNFRELLVNHPSVRYAFMYTLQQENVHKLFSKDSFAPLPFETFKELEIYQKVIARDGLPLWIGPYEHTELTGDEQVFTLARVVKDIDTLANKGILLVQIHNSDLESIFRYFRYKEEYTNYMIVNEDGLILYDSNRELEQQWLDELMPTQDWGKGYDSERTEFRGVDSVVSAIHFGSSENWRLVAVTPWSIIGGEFKWIGIIIALAIGICMIFACLFILIFIQRISKAIVETVQVMREVERGNLYARVEVRGNDEIGLLTRGFNRLLYRLDELIEEVKEQHERKRAAEMAALQAQIKPHFLFNTLESINILAIQNQGKKVSQMVTKLGNILRISIQQQEEITIEQELAHVRSYLDIQSYRFEDLFEYDIVIEERLLHYMTLKLSLQPLVENCIQHGFEGIEYLGSIRIEISDSEDHLYFRVQDNGHGITAEQLGKIHYMSSDVSAFVNIPQLGERRGIGVSNVADRIRIRFGEPYGLMICSMPGHGTIIQMTIPK
ncbi:MAG TPA: sensor histidine kinase [Candidatus Paenibacillus intestinavium]|nr:sensor histidine kinase [Candidatus Paenibacillus intestinavium]